MNRDMGLKEEISCWDGWLKEKGGVWPDDYATRLDPNTPLQAHLVTRLPDKAEVSILDVGAGPLTIVGKIWPGHEVNIVAVDALASEYDKLLCWYGVDPLIRTQQCEMERLDSLFAPYTFDLVYCRNALDHCIDPVAAIRQMYDAAKLGGCVLLDHETNEGENEKYAGLHQWNIESEGNSVLIWNKDHRYYLGEIIGNVGVTCTTHKGWNLVSLRKLD
jgi:SAM-dependent methyltransferase